MSGHYDICRHNNVLEDIKGISEGRQCNTFAHSDKSVKLGRQVHVTLLLDKINGSTLGNKRFR